MESLRIGFEDISTMARALCEAQTLERASRYDLLNDQSSGASSALHGATTIDFDEHSGDSDAVIAGDSVGSFDE